jgi:cellulose synthase/poly-beta-1,6-N-acetylglucosamine synthase-like glycosyltransferase
MVLRIIWVLLVFSGFIYWLVQLIASIRVVRSVPVLEKIPEHDLAVWPKVSVIMPARNEEKRMKEALETRLRDDYPNIEYIIVDDRSTDCTGQIADDVARKDPRVRVLHLQELPDDWLGKLHAMDRGLKIATGEWLLFSDIDVHVQPGTVRKAIAFAEHHEVDHVPIMPEIYPGGLIIDILSTLFVRFISLGGRLWAVQDPDSTAAVGSGSFNLVHRCALERAGGFRKIRLEQGDDVALGMILKGSGSRQVLMNGRKHVGVRMYESLREAMVAVERPTYTALGNFSFIRLFVAGWVILWLELSPYLAFISLGIPLHGYIAGTMVGISIVTSVLINRWYGRPIWSVFFAPVGSVIMVAMIWRSGFLGAVRGGVYWRGTFYRSEVLKKQQRWRL